jgi:SAM-dependent methyltransferase
VCGDANIDDVVAASLKSELILLNRVVRSALMSNDGRRQRLRRNVYDVVWYPRLKSLLERLPFIRRVYNGWARRHPFDVEHGVDTSGSLSAAECAPDAAMASQILPYAGSQPSIVRAGIALLPDHNQYAFVDLGCGKGRALMVASEFSFARLVGVEISQDLAEITRRNAAVIALRDPRRASIEIQVGDATAMRPPAERVVYFMYNPFGRALMETLVDGLERQLANGLQHAFLVYYNPVHGDVLDRSPHFARWQAETIPYADGELGFGPDLSDTLVTWQTLPGLYPAQPRASRRIVINGSGLHASLEESRQDRGSRG